MRGKGLLNKGGPGHKQYPAHAELLRHEPEYLGENYSFGDEYIWKVAHGELGPGNPTTWVQAGVNHHLTFVLHQVAALTADIGTAQEEHRDQISRTSPRAWGSASVTELQKDQHPQG